MDGLREFFFTYTFPKFKTLEKLNFIAHSNSLARINSFFS